MSVNPPGQVSFYFDVLVLICTFDPIPMDIIYELIPILEFDYTFIATDRAVFSRIGIEDRNFVNVLGSLFLFMILFGLAGTKASQEEIPTSESSKIDELSFMFESVFI